MVTENPRATSSFAMDDEMIPFPNEDVTPPVTKIYLVVDMKTKLYAFEPQKYTIYFRFLWFAAAGGVFLLILSG
jgi:hypothetical protein